MGQPKIDYETNPENGKVKAKVIGGNGEVVWPTEWYDSRSNADRGLADGTRVVLALVASGEIDLSRAT